MSKRHLDGIDAFDASLSPDLSLQEVDSNLFGQLQNADEGKQVARPVDIFEIHTDPAQPRRAIPTLVRAYWDGNPQEIGEVFTRWYQMVCDERHENFDLDSYLRAEQDIERPDKIGPVEASFLTLIELAVSIKIHGLTNPITVIRSQDGKHYRLETGERRWLAYHLLNWHFGNEFDRKWSKISARAVKQLNIWRQAAENNARSNLNAISKARQLAVLLMDLYRTEYSTTFTEYGDLIHPGDSDREYYAQVADGEQFPVPRGRGEQVYSAMGFKNARQIRDYRGLLRLPDLVWQVADDMNWTEYALRSMREKSRDDRDLMGIAVERAEEEGYVFPDTVPVGTLKRKKTVKPKKKLENVPGTRDYFSQLDKALQRVGEGRTKENKTALKMLDDLQAWIEAEQERLQQLING